MSTSLENALKAAVTAAASTPAARADEAPALTGALYLAALAGVEAS